MKKNIKIVTMVMAFFLAATSCSDFYDVNTDPNNSPTSTVELTLPAGVASVAFVLGDQWQILGSIWSQHWTQSTGANQYATIDNYDVNENTYNTAYTELYAGALNDLQFVSTKAEETEDWNYFLMAEVMKAYTFQLLVDFYDKVPYTEALKGTDNLNPKFENGDVIYDDLIVKIDNALSKDRTVRTARAVGDEDLVFQGDMEQWVRFANTLKLKIFMRQSKARPAIAQAGIQALFASGAQFLETTDAAMTDFVDVENFRNPFYATQISTAGTGRGYVDIAASATMLDFLVDVGDPRLFAIYNPAVTGGAYVGLTQGDYTNTGFATARNLSQPNISPVQPVIFLSVSESKFLQAEAVVRYGVAGDAKALYEQGIDASFAKLDVENPGDVYGAGKDFEYAPATTDEALELILTQKWVSMANYQGAESYLEIRRTGYPTFLTVPPNNVTSGVYPQRLPYPSTELDNNRVQLNAAGGQKQVTARVWWNPAS